MHPCGTRLGWACGLVSIFILWVEPIIIKLLSRAVADVHPEILDNLIVVNCLHPRYVLGCYGNCDVGIL